MDWTTGLQRAIDYVEDHLTEPLDYAEIARQTYSSSFHFQRIFSILCGYTLGEYIRSRRLTLAGNELLRTDSKVIDVALKYGYDSPESFSRAFARIHGVLPSRVKSGTIPLKSFSRLSVKLILEGGSLMDYRIETSKGFRMLLKKTRFKQGSEITKPQIHQFWGQCNADGTTSILSRRTRPDSMFGDAIIGVCFNDPERGDFDYAIGVPYDGGEVPEGFAVEEIPGGSWAAFRCTKKQEPISDSFQALWKQIYSEFFPTSEFQPAHGVSLELYESDRVNEEGYTFEIWVAVRKQ